jgi:hypothetical protein
MNRNDKIELLKNIGAGRVTLEDLHPKELLYKVGYPGEKYFVNGKPVKEDVFLSEYERQIKSGALHSKGITYGPDLPIVAD